MPVRAVVRLVHVPLSSWADRLIPYSVPPKDPAYTIFVTPGGGTTENWTGTLATLLENPSSIE